MCVWKWRWCRKWKLKWWFCPKKYCQTFLLWKLLKKYRVLVWFTRLSQFTYQMKTWGGHFFPVLLQLSNRNPPCSRSSHRRPGVKSRSISIEPKFLEDVGIKVVLSPTKKWNRKTFWSFLTEFLSSSKIWRGVHIVSDF